jgi:hypothetical protein
MSKSSGLKALAIDYYLKGVNVKDIVMLLSLFMKGN